MTTGAPAGRAELRVLAHSLLRTATGAREIARLCPRCGSGRHGRPVAVPDVGTAAPAVSISYAHDLVAVAWSYAGPVGVDVEDDGGPVEGVGRTAFSRAEALAKADAVVPVRALDLPPGFVGWVAGAGVSWRLAGPAAPAR